MKILKSRLIQHTTKNLFSKIVTCISFFNLSKKTVNKRFTFCKLFLQNVNKCKTKKRDLYIPDRKITKESAFSEFPPSYNKSFQRFIKWIPLSDKIWFATTYSNEIANHLFLLKAGKQQKKISVSASILIAQYTLIFFSLPFSFVHICKLNLWRRNSACKYSRLVLFWIIFVVVIVAIPSR